ncbi:MAG: putative immunity protein [Candidatus Aminicenantales bacterium]
MANLTEKRRAMKKKDAEPLSLRSHRALVLRAVAIAERVLPYFEEKYPKDDRPRKALEAGRAWTRGEITMRALRAAAFSAHAAARDAEDAAARTAARAAGQAASTAHAAGHAPHAAAYAAKTAAAADFRNKGKTGKKKIVSANLKIGK